MRDIALEQLGPPFPLLELLVLRLQPIDLARQADIGMRARQGMAPHDNRRGKGFEQGRGQIDEAVACIADRAVADAA